MDEDSSILKADMSGWVNLLGPLVGWDSNSLGVRVNLFQDSSGVGISDKPVGLLLVSELGSPLGALLDYYTLPHVGLLLIVDIPPGSKVRYPELVVFFSWSTLAVPTSGSCPKFPPPPSGTCLTSPYWATLAATIYGGWHTLPWRHERSWNWFEEK